MSVELDPVELGFKRPFTHEVSQVLRLQNPNSDPVAFKVKTTAPKQYCVRPNSGRIEAGKDVEVQVLLQAMKEDPPPDAKCRDKFLVQSVAISASNESSNISEVWSHIESTAKSSIQEKKIRVLFLPADGTAVNGVNSSEVSNSYGSPSPAPATPQRASEAPGLTSAGLGAGSGASPFTSVKKESSPADSTSYADTTQSARGASSGQSTVAAAASSVANAVPTSTEDLQAQLDQAKQTILRLREQAEQQVLRQRKSDAVNQDSKERITTGTTGMGVQQVPASGVPVQVAAGLCLLCFLIAYFFF